MSKRKVIEVMAGAKRKISCGETFTCNIVSLAKDQLYVFSVLSFVGDSMEKCRTNADIHNTCTYKSDVTCMCYTLVSVNIRMELRYTVLCTYNHKFK
jgi:hypothetical protein